MATKKSLSAAARKSVELEPRDFGKMDHAEFRKARGSRGPADEPTDEQWNEIKEIATRQVSNSLHSPAEHLAYVRRQIGKALTLNVD